MTYRLTKTAYLSFLKCPQEFWLEYHEPLLSREPITLEHEHLGSRVTRSRIWFANWRGFRPNDTQVIEFQRTFQTADLAARTDVVVTDKATGEIEIYEIKSTNSVKDEHYDDVAFQKVAAERMGFTVRRTHIITMNGEYVRQGEIDVEQLFMITDVTAETDARLADTEDRDTNGVRLSDTVPVPRPGRILHRQQARLPVSKAAFLGPAGLHGFRHLVSQTRQTPRSAGTRASSTSATCPTIFASRTKQKLQVSVARSGEPSIERDKISERMCEWEYPLHFLDYETFAYAIPQFDGIRPFQQMVFQYSLHTIDRPGAEMRHSEYLLAGDDDPPRVVAEHLRRPCPAASERYLSGTRRLKRAATTRWPRCFPISPTFLTR